MKISACIMVKNGGDLFKGTLASLAGVVDELIVVNTADEDVTPDTIAALEAKGIAQKRVIHSPWQKDFSLHRNQSIEAASGDWIIVIDADEVIKPASGQPELRGWLKSLPEEYKSLVIEMLDVRAGAVTARQTQARIFRKGYIQYEGKVHNVAIHPRPSVFCPCVVFEHYGYGLDAKAMAEKFQRTTSLLEDELANGNMQAHFYLAEQFGMREMDELAVPYILEYLKHREALGENFFKDAYFVAMRQCMKTGKQEEAKTVLWQALADHPADCDVRLAQTEIGIWLGDLTLAMDGAREWLGVHDDWLSHPDHRGTRVSFSFSREVYITQLYRLWCFSMMQGLDILDRLEKVWGDALPTMKKEMREEISRLFTGKGIDGMIRRLVGSGLIIVPNLEEARRASCLN